MKTNILGDFQICISVPLSLQRWSLCLLCFLSHLFLYRKFENKNSRFGNENSQNSLAKKVTFQLKTAENKYIETKDYVTPLICLPVKNQPLNLAKKHFGKYNVNFADQRHLGDKIHFPKACTTTGCSLQERFNRYMNLVI